MRRVGAILAALIVLVVVLGSAARLFSGSAESQGDQVAAVFDSVTGLVSGQDVTVAGVTVGTVDSIELTPSDRALVTMRIDPKFARFYANANCTLGNRFLLGERYVACDPGRPSAGPLGSRDGLPTVPLAHTSAPVEADLVLSFAQLPYRQRLELVLNELGIAVAARGQDLNATIRRAAPALRDTRRVLAIVAGQRRALGGAISSTNRVLAALADRPQRLTGFIHRSAQVSSRLAAHSSALQGTTRDLPAFLRQAKPALADLDSLAVDSTPLLRSLRRSAPSVHHLVAELEPFSQRALPALRTLAAVAPVGRRAVNAAAPSFHTLVPVAAQARSGSPVGDALTKSLVANRFPESLMHFTFYGTRAVARFDATSHLLPAHGALSPCSIYDTGAPVPVCAALFNAASAGAAAKAGRSAGGRLQSRGRARRERPPSGEGPTPSAPGAPAPAPPGAQPVPPGAPAVPGLPNLPDLPPLPGGLGGSGHGGSGGPGDGPGDILDFLLGP